MSGTVPSSTSVLLPAASIGVFSNHEETRAAVAALASDWRFARVRFEVRPGDVAHAIQAYAGTPSPNLLILDTDVIDSSFTAMLEQLAGVCSEGTDAVVVGPVNDVALYRYLINLGVEDYLVRPLQTATISDVVARILLKQLGASDSQLIAVVGAKGGTGVSTLAELLAYGLGEKGGHKTILLDGACGRSYLSVAFGLEPVTTLAETARAAAATDPNALNRMLIKAGQNLQILGTGNDRFLDEGAPPEQMEKVLDRLLAVTPYVIADLSGAVPALQRLVLSRAQRVMLVSLPTLSSLRLTRSLISEIKDLKGGHFEMLDLVVNMVGIAPGAEVGRADIETALGHKIAVTVPFESRLVIGAESQAKVLGAQKGAEKIMADLVARLQARPVGSDPDKSPAGLFDSFLRKVGK